MRRKPSHSARTVALATVFCALGIAFGCGRQRFELLPDESPISAGRASGGGGAGSGGNSGSAGKALGGAGKGGEVAELGGFGAFAGFGGRLVFPTGGFGNSPCLGEAGCRDELCPDEALPFCTACRKDYDCLESYHCDHELDRCVQCRNNSECANPGQHCNPTTFRCTKACTPGTNNSCDQRSICSQDGVCVSCSKDPDCPGYPSAVCYLNICVECYRDEHCLSSQERCFYGHCIPRD